MPHVIFYTQHDREFGTSKWVIQSNGIKVSWDAKNTVEVGNMGIEGGGVRPQ